MRVISPRSCSSSSRSPSSRKLALAVSVAGLALVAGAAPAAADVVSVHGEIHGGGAAGTGLGGDQKDDAFHDGASGATYGAKLGVELLFIDAWIGHDQYIGSGGSLRTWTSFFTGLDLDFDLGDGPVDPETQKRGPAKVFGEVGMAVGFGVGTGQQVDPPLDYAQVSDKGFLFRVHLGINRRLNRVISVGISLPVEAAYLFKSGPGAVANDLSTHYQSIDAAVLLNLRMTFSLR